MSKEITGVNSLIPRAFGYNYTVLHEDYVMILKISAIARYERSQKTDQDKRERDTRLTHAVAKAYISYSLETLANKAYGNTHSEEDLWTYISFPELERRLQGACKMRTLKDAMGELVEDGYVFKRPNRNPKYNTLEYRMNLEQYRREILSLPSKSKDTSAKMHDLEEGTGADLHDEGTSANLHDAKMHDNQCKNAPTPSANLHAIINSNKQTDKLKEDTYSRDFAFAQHDTPTPLSLEDRLEAARQLLQAHGQYPQELSTPIVDTPSENVENVEPIRQDDVQTESKQAESYSRTTTQTVTPEPAQSPDTSRTGTSPSEKPKRVRKPKVEDPITVERIDKVVVYFDQLLQEVTGDAKAEYGKTKAARTDIKEILLPCNPTEKRLRKIYLALWNTPPDPKTGFHWRDNMSIKAVCKQYQSKVIGIIAEEQKEADKQKAKQVMGTITANSTLMAQQEEDYVFDINHVRGNSHRGRRSAS